MAAIRNNPEALRYASANCRDRLELVRAAVAAERRHCDEAGRDSILHERPSRSTSRQPSSPKADTSRTAGTREDVDAQQEAQRTAGRYLRFASARLRQNYALVRYAIEKNACNLEFADAENLRDNEELVAFAVQLSGVALQYASARLRNREHIVRRAIDQGAAAEQQRGRESVSLGDHHKHHSRNYTKSPDCRPISFSDLRYRDYALALYAVQQCGGALEYLGEDFRDDDGICW
ncbi:unnamed protein product, partial [Amoebophrya sp. A120]|eukprot:GSA120T00006184001.1